MPGSGHASSRSLSHTLRPRQGQSQRVLLSRGQVSGELDFQVRLAPGSLALSPTEECGPHLSTSQAATPYCLRSHSHGPPLLPGPVPALPRLPVPPPFPPTKSETHQNSLSNPNSPTGARGWGRPAPCEVQATPPPGGLPMVTHFLFSLGPASR